MLRAVSSQRKTPANLSPNGTTALLKTLLAVGKGSRRMIGLFEYRQTTLSQSAGFSCHGILGSASPTMVCADRSPMARITGAVAALPPVDATLTVNPFRWLPISIHQGTNRLVAGQCFRVPIEE